MRFLNNRVGIMITWFCISAIIALIGSVVLSYGPPLIGITIVMIAIVSAVFLLIVTTDQLNNTLEDIADFFKKDE